MTEEHPAFTVAAVDDDPSILRSLECLLDSADYAVRLFGSAHALLDSACLPEIDCLISDIDMPGADGFELLRRLDRERPGLPIILITGYPDRLKRLSAMADHRVRFFTKPFQGPQLLAAVSDAIAAYRG